MSEELEALGGGDATAAEAAVVCRISPPVGDEAPIVTTGEDSYVHVRDPRCPPDTPEQQAVRRYRVSLGGVLDCSTEEHPHQALYEMLGRDALDWVLSGFNAAVIAHGESGSGKTHALFGTGMPSERTAEQHGLCSQLLERLFDLCSTHSSGLSVGLSCWEVRHNGVFDLLARGGGEDVSVDAGGQHCFVVVSAPSLPEAKQIIAVSRNRSVNWAPAALGKTQHAALSNRASSFLRVVIHDAVRQCVSSLYIVDLAGSAPLSMGSSGPLNSERKALNQQLLAFNRVVAELSQIQHDGGAKVLSARDTKLTQVLAPLLAGSCKTFLLACVRAEAEHFLDTCNTLRVATRALGIRSPCLRLLNVSVADVPMLRPSTVLPPKEVTRATPNLLTAAAPRRASHELDSGLVSTSTSGPSPSPASVNGVQASRNKLHGRSSPPNVIEGTPSSPTQGGAVRPACIGLASAPEERQDSSPATMRRKSTPALDSNQLKHSAVAIQPLPSHFDHALQQEIYGMVEQLRTSLLSEPETQAGIEDWVRDELERRVTAKLKAARSETPGAVADSTLTGDMPNRGYAAQHAAQRRLIPNPAAQALEDKERWSGTVRVPASIGAPIDDDSARRLYLEAQLVELKACSMDISQTQMNAATTAASAATAAAKSAAASAEASRSSANASASSAMVVADLAHDESYGGLSDFTRYGNGSRVNAMMCSNESLPSAGFEGCNSLPHSSCICGDAQPSPSAEVGGFKVGSGTADARAENYDTVLRMLKEVDAARLRESQRAEELQRDLEERSVAHAVEAEELKREHLEIRKKLRRLEGESLFGEVFEMYEAEIASLQAELACKRTELTDLENTCRDTAMQLENARQAKATSSPNHSADESPDSTLALGHEERHDAHAAYAAVKISRVRSWRKALAASEKETAALRSEMQEMQKRMRHTEVHRRACDDITKKLQRLTREKEKQAQELTSLQLANSELSQKNEFLREQVNEIQGQYDAAQHKAATLLDELESLRKTNAKLEYERRKDAVVMRMAPRLPATEQLAGKPLHFGARRSKQTNTAPEILHNLEHELRSGGARNPKANILLSKAMREVDALEMANQEGAAREEELLQMLVSAIAPEGGPKLNSKGKSSSKEESSCAVATSRR